jgi:hypothetical protein
MIVAPPPVPAFDAFVDREVWNSAPGSADFGELLARLPGIAPTDAHRALVALSREHPQLRNLLANARLIAPPVVPFDQGANLPLAHPLDMEWRFSNTTADHLLWRAVEATKPGEAILLLGVPSIAAAAAQSSVDRAFQVAGEGNIICDTLEKATSGDPRFVHGHTVDGLASAAVIDPPWYLDAYADMLTMCSVRCAPGAILFLALPPVGIRPSARTDQALMLAAAAEAGFDVTGEREIIRYRSPLFELAAWRAAGIGAWLPEWRTGELVQLTKRRAPKGQSVVLVRPPAFELTVQGVRLRLLLDRTGPATLEPIVAGEILPSVSARFPGRERATLWTTSNRAFAVDSTLALPAMVRVAQARGVVLPIGFTGEGIASPDGMIIDAIQTLTHQINQLADREIAIASELVGETAWLRSLTDARFLSARSQGFPQIRHGAVA